MGLISYFFGSPVLNKKSFSSRRVEDKEGYYLINFPRNMTLDKENLAFRKAVAELEEQIPIVLNLENIRKFDSSGLGFIFGLINNYSGSPFAAFGYREGCIVMRTMQVNQVDDIFRKRVQIYRSLGEILRDIDPKKVA